MKRTKLSDRTLPDYTPGEEFLNTATHAAGAVLSAVGLLLCLLRSVSSRNLTAMITGCIYGIALTGMYLVSAVYHGLRPGTPKKVMQVIDHCTIYFLIAGTYTVILLCALAPIYPRLAWGVFALEWSLAGLATVLTAIDLKRYSVFSMVCYIGMGWAIIPFWRQVLQVMGSRGFGLLLAGGIAYTIGSILYGLGKKKKWMHSVFHLFVLLGSLLQFFAVLFHVL